MTYYDTRIVCVEFDGVLNRFNGWMGNDELGVPMMGAKEFLDILCDEYEVYIFTVRDKWKVMAWLDKHGMRYDFVTDIKVDAIAYIGSKFLTFNGEYDETLKELREFSPYWKI